MANAIRLDLDSTEPAALAGVRNDLDRNLEHEDLRALSSTSQADSRYGFDQHMLMIYVFLIVMSAVIGGVGGLGLMTTMSLNVMERRRELGVCARSAHRRRRSAFIVVAEGIAVGLLSWAWRSSRPGRSLGLGDPAGDGVFKSGLDFAIARADADMARRLDRARRRRQCRAGLQAAGRAFRSDDRSVAGWEDGLAQNDRLG